MRSTWGACFVSRCAEVYNSVSYVFCRFYGQRTLSLPRSTSSRFRSAIGQTGLTCCARYRFMALHRSTDMQGVSVLCCARLVRFVPMHARGCQRCGTGQKTRGRGRWATQFGIDHSGCTVDVHGYRFAAFLCQVLFDPARDRCVRARHRPFVGCGIDQSKQTRRAGGRWVCEICDRKPGKKRPCSARQSSSV